MTHGSPSDVETVAPGEVVYTEDGDAVGIVSSVTSDGIEVTVPDDERASASLDDASGALDGEERPGQEFGEGHLMWRCDECGGMADLDGGIPDRCPECGAPKTAIYRIRED